MFMITENKICNQKSSTTLFAYVQSCNNNFGDDIKYYLDKEVLELFRKSFFGIFLNMPQCNFQGQNIKMVVDTWDRA